MRMLPKSNEARQPGAEVRTTAEHSTHWETGRLWSFHLEGVKVQEAHYEGKHDLDLGKVGNPIYGQVLSRPQMSNKYSFPRLGTVSM